MIICRFIIKSIEINFHDLSTSMIQNSCSQTNYNSLGNVCK
ncbi:hypothetical protein C1O63_0465 [Dehalococcoides mccartyi]|nr:hypothetical protein C1O63_0465 [Dehalococcoides mccartyi]